MLKKSSDKLGFSLLELVFMMTLVSIIGLSVISSSNTQNPSVQTAMLKVASDIRYAQDRAMITGVKHGFKTLGSHSYEIYEDEPGNPVTDPSTFSDMTIDLDTDYKNVTFMGSYQVEFNTYGQPIIGGGTSVGLNREGYTRVFSVTSNTGLLQLP